MATETDCARLRTVMESGEVEQTLAIGHEALEVLTSDAFALRLADP